MQRNRLSRRSVIAGAAGVGAATILHWPANAAEFSYKLGSSAPMDHPAMAHDKIAADKIKQETNGRLEITIYPNSVLGGDTAMISQVISGALEMYNLPVDLLAPRNPACGIAGVGFAFPDMDHVWAAMDGDLGAMLRGIAEQMGLYCLEKGYDHGFRQITTRTKPITEPRRSARLQDSPAGGAVSDFVVPPSRRLADRDQLQRGLQRVADRHRGRAGKPAGSDRHRQAVRGAEILQPDQPCLVRVPYRRSTSQHGSACHRTCRRRFSASSAWRRWHSGRTS